MLVFSPTSHINKKKKQNFNILNNIGGITSVWNMSVEHSVNTRAYNLSNFNVHLHFKIHTKSSSIFT